MPIARDPKCLPKPCQDMLDIMKAQGICTDVTKMVGEDIAKLPHPVRQKCFVAVGNDLRKRLPARHEINKTIVDDVVKREWIASYFNDPESGGNVVINETSRKTQRVDKVLKVLLTQAQLGGPNFLNSIDHAQIMVDSNELTSHKHRRKALADAGVLEYEWEVTTEELVKLVEEGVISRSEASLSSEHVEALNEALRDPTRNTPGSSNSGGSNSGGAVPPVAVPKKKPKIQAPIDPEAEAKSALKKEADKAFAKQKTDTLGQVKKMNGELLQIDGILEALRSKSWGGPPAEVLEKARAVQQESATALYKAWTAASTCKFTTLSIDDVQKRTSDLLLNSQNTSESYKRFLKDDVAEFSSLRKTPSATA